VPVILLSLAAALAFAVAAVLQQHAAAAQPPEHNLRPILVLRLLQRPMWLAGLSASVVGTALQLIALWHGSLVTVQPLLVCGLLFALPINAIWMHKRRPGARELLAAAVVCLGLVILLVATDPRAGRGTGSPEGWAIALSSLAVAVVVLVGFALVTKKATLRAGLLAAGAGLINGLSAAFTKGVARNMENSWHHGVVSVITGVLGNWELYAFGGTLLLAVLLVQSAFQSGPIRWSLPALTAANPIASVLLGALLLGEHIRAGDAPIIGAVAGLVLVVAGIMALSSSNLLTGGLEVPRPATAGIAPATGLASGTVVPSTAAAALVASTAAASTVAACPAASTVAACPAASTVAASPVPASPVPASPVPASPVAAPVTTPVLAAPVASAPVAGATIIIPARVTPAGSGLPSATPDTVPAGVNVSMRVVPPGVT
jgi:drug/metabolite transporter (DMT)-like permease